MMSLVLNNLALLFFFFISIGIIHLIGSLSSLGKGMTYLDLSKTKLSTKGIKSVAEIMSKNSQVFSSLQTLILAELSGGKAEDLQVSVVYVCVGGGVKRGWWGRKRVRRLWIILRYISLIYYATVSKHPLGSLMTNTPQLFLQQF